MSNLVNLNKARKDRVRDAKRRDANAHSAKFGRSKADKQALAAKLSKASKTLDAHKVDDADP
jgi:predicted metal-dependent HD superfamily phosphohydrolase